MDIRPLSPDYAVSEQIVPDDMPAIVAAGYKSILCNRPNDEIPASICCDTMRTATEAAGLIFADNPFNQMQFGEDVIARQPVVNEDVEQRLHDVLDARAGLPALGEPELDLSEHAQLGRRDLRGSCSITQTN